MYVTYLRSSSVSTFDYCNLQWMFQYLLGWPSTSGLKAAKGNAVHKALEILARQKLAQQEGKTGFVEEESKREFSIDEVTPELAMRVGYDHYSDPSRTIHVWSDKDWRDCSKWLRNVLEWDGGTYDPRNRTIVAPELFFDITFDESWARYDYILPDGKQLTGQLSIKGTTDLLTEIAPGVFELIDWKTGARKNYQTDLQKEYGDFIKDFQFKLYHLALNSLFPDKEIHITIFYARDGGPFSIPHDMFKGEDIKQDIRKQFERIRDNNTPQATRQRWKCSVCSFKDSCPGIREELYQVGMEEIIKKYGNLSKLNNYGSGGGKTNRGGENEA